MAIRSQVFRRYSHPLTLLLLAAVCYVLFFHRLGAIGFLGPDEPRYASVARDMYMTGDYITPRLNGVPWFEKPALMYWGAAIGYAIFGVNELGARFPSAVSAAMCVFFVYICGRKLWNPAAGFLAALLMATSVGFFAFARAASMDMPLTACLTLALLCFLMAQQAQEPERARWFYAFYALLGFGALAKGPVAFVLPAISLFGFLALRGRLAEWKTWHPKAALLALAVPAPWYVLCTWRNGYEFIQVFIINQNFQRFTSTIHGHNRPFYYYIPVLLMLTFPWTFVLISALRRRFERSDQILLWWAIVPLVFFSLSGSKLPGYILPAVPPIALLCAAELRRASSRLFKVAIFIEAGAMVFIGVALGFFGNMLNLQPHVDGMVIAGVTFVMAAMLIIIALWLEPPFLAGFNLIAVTLLVLAVSNFIFPRFDKTDTMRPWSKALDGIVPENERVFLYQPEPWMEYGLQFYRHGNARAIYSTEELAAAIQSAPQVLCIASDKTVDQVSHMSKVDMKIVQTIENETAFWAWQTK